MEVILDVFNSYTFIKTDFPTVALDKKLSYMIPNYFMSPLYNICQSCKAKIIRKTGRCSRCNKPRVWDGRKKLLSHSKIQGYSFPTGLLNKANEIFHSKNCSVSYRDKRKVLKSVPLDDIDTLTLVDPNTGGIRSLWDNQRAALKAIFTYTRGVIQVPTSGGKTTILSGIAKLLPDENICIIIHNTSIAAQLVQEISGMLDEEVGMIGDGEYNPKRVTVCTVQTLCHSIGIFDRKEKKAKEKVIQNKILEKKVTDYINSITVLLGDEIQHASSNSWYTLAGRFVNAYYRIGVTGTAFMRSQGDDIYTEGAFGPLLYEISEQEMIEDGKIARPIIHLYKIESPILDPDLSYQDVYQLGIVESEVYNNKIASLAIEAVKNGEQTLILCQIVEHMEYLYDLLKDKIKVGFLSGITKHEGKTKRQTREDTKQKFIDEELNVLIASSIYNEGISIHNIDFLIRGALMKSEITGKQQVGRGQRKGKEKDTVKIADFIHTTHEYLSNHSFEHIRQYKKLGYKMILHDD